MTYPTSEPEITAKVNRMNVEEADIVGALDHIDDTGFIKAITENDEVRYGTVISVDRAEFAAGEERNHQICVELDLLTRRFTTATIERVRLYNRDQFAVWAIGADEFEAGTSRVFSMTERDVDELREHADDIEDKTRETRAEIHRLYLSKQD